jgi:hypothetical protein
MHGVIDVVLHTRLFIFYNRRVQLLAESMTEPLIHCHKFAVTFPTANALSCTAFPKQSAGFRRLYHESVKTSVSVQPFTGFCLCTGMHARSLAGRRRLVVSR